MRMEALMEAESLASPSEETNSWYQGSDRKCCQMFPDPSSYDSWTYLTMDLCTADSRTGMR